MSDKDLKDFHFTITYKDSYSVRAKTSEEVEKMLEDGKLEPYDSEMDTSIIEQIKCGSCQ